MTGQGNEEPLRMDGSRVQATALKAPTLETCGRSRA